MCGSNNILASDLIYNVLAVAEKENKRKIEVAVKQEAAFQTDSERKLFYITYNKNNESERTSLNNRKVPNIYCPPKYRNLLAMHLISSLSAETDTKYLTYGFQQSFLPAPGACIYFEPKRTFET